LKKKKTKVQDISRFKIWHTGKARRKNDVGIFMDKNQ